MNATMRMTPWQAGHARGSTSKICGRSAAHRRLASVGTSRGAETMAGGAGGGGLGLTPHPGTGSRAGGWHTRHSTVS